jgi:hypothetical protein
MRDGAADQLPWPTRAGLLLLGIDAGRPWNFYWMVCSRGDWNLHSPLAEVGHLHVDLRR